MVLIKTPKISLKNIKDGGGICRPYNIGGTNMPCQIGLSGGLVSPISWIAGSDWHLGGSKGIFPVFSLISKHTCSRTQFLFPHILRVRLHKRQSPRGTFCCLFVYVEGWDHILFRLFVFNMFLLSPLTIFQMVVLKPWSLIFSSENKTLETLMTSILLCIKTLRLNPLFCNP